jgi:hypothetical protein
MAPRLRGDDSGEALPHIFFSFSFLSRERAGIGSMALQTQVHPTPDHRRAGTRQALFHRSFIAASRQRARLPFINKGAD